MGIKGDLPSAPTVGAKPDILKKQEEMFNNMEQQYEVARATTHTQRGVGLGYATGGYQFPRWSALKLHPHCLITFNIDRKIYEI